MWVIFSNIYTYREEELRKKIGFLHLFAFLFVSVLTGSASAAGYNCPALMRYTSCNQHYYLSTSNGGACSTTGVATVCSPCSAFSDGTYTCAGGTACPAASARTCAAGTYWNGSACATCGVGYYCPGFTNVSNPATGYGRNACPSGYTGGTIDNKSAQAQCQLVTTAGKYVATASAGEVNCLAGGACPGSVTINYSGTGSTGGRNVCSATTWSTTSASSCTACPTGYTAGSITGKTAQAQCQLITTASKYVATASAGEVNCIAGGACPGSVTINYSGTGSTGGRNECVGATWAAASASSCTACPTIYITDMTNGKDAQNKCRIQTTAGSYIATANAGSQTTCGTGYDCPASWIAYGGTGVRTAKTYSVKLDYQDGTSGFTTITVTYDATPANVSVPTYLGRTFMGYFSSVSGGTQYFTSTGVASQPWNIDTASPVLYAQWSTASVTCAAGKYLPANSTAVGDCANCEAGNYCPGGNYALLFASVQGKTQCAANSYSGANAASCTSCTTLAGGAYPKSVAGSDNANKCYASCTAGMHVATANTACAVLTTNNKYVGAHDVMYGSVSTVSTCTGSYVIIGKTLATEHSSINSCYLECTSSSIAPPTGATKNPVSATVSYPGTCTYTASCPAGYSPVGDNTATPSCSAGTFTITFLPNGGTIAGGNHTKTCTTGMSCILNDTELNNYVRTGYAFGGWSETTTGTAAYQNGGNVTGKTTNFNLYAVWDKCAAGYTWNGTACSACPRGTWKAAGTTASGTATTCTACGTGQMTDTTGSTSAAACKACPAGSFCGADGIPVSCSTATGSSHTLSAAGASTINACYAICSSLGLSDGSIAIPDSPSVFYPTNCEYTDCTSNVGRPGIIVGGTTCEETSCLPGFESIMGLCTACNRPGVLSYTADEGCEIESCVAGYHVTFDKLYCEQDIIACTSMYADDAIRTWDHAKKAYGPCIIQTCEPGYHVSSNACVLNEQTCTVENGIGTQEWDVVRARWGECEVTFCSPGFTSDPSQTNERAKSCGQCKNRYSVLGEVAVSSYSSECNIAACMYQGEMYNLEANECTPICNVSGYEDETGTMQWNSVSKKCVRQCKDGFTAW